MSFPAGQSYRSLIRTASRLHTRIHYNVGRSVGCSAILTSGCSEILTSFTLHLSQAPCDRHRLLTNYCEVAPGVCSGTTFREPPIASRAFGGSTLQCETVRCSFRTWIAMMRQPPRSRWEGAPDLRLPDRSGDVTNIWDLRLPDQSGDVINIWDLRQRIAASIAFTPAERDFLLRCIEAKKDRSFTSRPLSTEPAPSDAPSATPPKTANLIS
jgi:hypothetical protein